MKKSALIILSLALTACVSNTYLAKQQYMLQAHNPVIIATKPVDANLTVEPMLASPPYDNVQFIYRLKNSEYRNDYYHIFMTEPTTQTTAALAQFLQNANLFLNVNSADMTLPANYDLKTQLTALYADYTDHTHPKAVMEIQFILLEGNQIVLHTLLTAYSPLATKSTTALISAWNKDLTIILTKFSLKLMQQFHLTQASSVQVQTMPPAQATARPTTPAVKPSTDDEHGFLRLYTQRS